MIYSTYPELTEGEMARLRSSVVNTSALADLARSVGLGHHIALGKGEEASGGRDKSSLLADTFEAVVGAVYLDRGIEVVTGVLEGLFERPLSELLAAGERYDAKTALQEVVVRDWGMLPRYRIVSTGPDHAKSFSAEVYAGEDLFGAGEGHSKKEAEQNAARGALKLISSRAPAGVGGRDAPRVDTRTRLEPPELEAAGAALAAKAPTKSQKAEDAGGAADGSGEVPGDSAS